MRSSRRRWSAPPTPLAARIAQYAAAGATDLMLGFADFPATRMVEIIAERGRPSG